MIQKHSRFGAALLLLSGTLAFTTVAYNSSGDTSEKVLAAALDSSLNERPASTNQLAQRRERLEQRRNQQIFEVPIIGRQSGIPVVEVTFNDRRKFPMMVDTGASVTIITPQMANQIGFRKTGTTRVKVANGETIEVPVGRVSSIDVGGAVIEDFTVLVAGAPLLGQNFFSGYNVTMRQNMIVFRERRR